MFKVPDHLVTKVKAGEELVISKMGNGEASLYGKEVVIIVPSAGLKLGDRFFATGTNKIIRSLNLTNFGKKEKQTQIHL